LEQSKPYLKNASLQRAKFEGKDAYLITLTYPGDHQRVYWIDAEKYLPLQGEYITPSKEGKSIERYKVMEWKRDIRLPSNAFVLKPPKGAKEVDWQTYQELQEQFNQKAGLHNKSILEGGK
jgi:outer membrane lipoprotein-sorting protein